MKKVMLLVLVAILLPLTFARADYLKGYLDEIGDTDHFLINTSSDTLDVTFSYPATAEFWVLVLGKSGTNLGYFDLSEGEVIQLTGGGKFILVIISQSGDGQWTASY